MAKTPTQGYSGKPLFQKLGMKPGLTCLAISPPDHYGDLVHGAEGVTFRKRAATSDIVHLFCPTRDVLDKQINKALSYVAPGGMLWISWPKKSSPLYQDLTEGDLRDAVLPLNWVDVKVCAVDQDWSGLKFLRRKKT